MTADQASLRVQRLGERNAMALALARLLSFAAVAEPALIRRIRLDLLPGSSAADEADLWFSNLVQSRSPNGLVFFPEVAEVLRRGLTVEARSGAWERTRQMHRGVRRAIQIEEELTYLGLDVEANRVRIDELLRGVVAELIGGRTELANWAGRAVPRLPAAVQTIESAAALRIAADLRLGRDPNWRGRLAAMDRMPAWVAAVLPSLGRARLGITLTDQEISLGPALTEQEAQSRQSIEVPNTPTVVVEVAWRAGDGRRSKLLFVEKGEVSQPETVGDGPIELVTLANETWTIHRAGTAPAQTQATPVTVSAQTDGYAVALHWRCRERIPGCLGFAVMRRRRSADGSGPGAEEVLVSRLGFDPKSAGGEPSTKAPFQRFSFIDRPTPRDTEFSYRVVPMARVSQGLHPVDALSSSWTRFIRVGPPKDTPVSVTFNRTFEGAGGLGLAPQDLTPLSQASLYEVIAKPGDPVRQALGGDLLSSLIALLSQAASSSSTVYAAMFELDDPEVLQWLEKLGKRANVILSNGGKRPNRPANPEARLRLQRSGVQVVDRILPSGKLAHNKFMVVCDPSGQPTTVWTGNVSWMSAALCARSNAAVTVNSPAVASAYLSYWKMLATSGGRATLASANTAKNRRTYGLGNATVQTWFAPAQNFVDIDFVASLVQKASQGILFLLSEPGQKAAVMQTIFEQKNLYLMGAFRQGPGLTLYRNGRQDRLSGKQLSFPLLDSVANPKSTKSSLGSTLQSRMVVIDPMGSHPVVLIGSHSFGATGSARNDENFLVIENDPELASRCAAHIEAFYQHYHFRTAVARGRSTLGLKSDDSWQDSWFEADRLAEIAFWMGEDLRTFRAPGALPGEPASAPQAKKVVRKKAAPKKAKKRAPKRVPHLKK